MRRQHDQRPTVGERGIHHIGIDPAHLARQFVRRPQPDPGSFQRLLAGLGRRAAGKGVDIESGQHHVLAQPAPIGAANAVDEPAKHATERLQQAQRQAG